MINHYYRVSTSNAAAPLWLKRFGFDIKTGELIIHWTQDEKAAGFFFLDQILKMQFPKSISGTTLLLWQRNDDGTDSAPIYKVIY